MASIETIKASDGSGNANVATVQSTRAALATTIVVDTVLGINPVSFAGTMGTPHTFTDPITSETITVISEATAVDFVGHVDGANLEIDTIAPGYTDAGSAIGDIVIIRPTTQWSDNVADVLDAEHEDNGTHAKEVITSRTEDTSPVTGDFVLTYDASAAALKKVQLGNVTPYKADKSVLTVDSNPYKFSVYKSAAQTGIVDNTITKVTFDTELFDTNGNFASSTYTAPVTGYYHIDAYISLLSPNNSAFQAIVLLYKNGASFQQTNLYPTAGGTSIYLDGNISRLVPLTAGDTLDIYVQMDVATGTVTVAAGATHSTFNGYLVSRT